MEFLTLTVSPFDKLRVTVLTNDFPESGRIFINKLKNPNLMATQDSSKEDQIRAKQAISPAGLGDQSADGTSGPGSEVPLKDVPPTALENEYLEGESDDPAANVRQLHPNRNADEKIDSSGPAYS